MSARRAVAAIVMCASLGLGAAGCSSTDTGNDGAVTNLDELGPDVAQLRLEVQQLREEVRSLREELATVTTTTTQPLR